MKFELSETCLAQLKSVLLYLFPRQYLLCILASVAALTVKRYPYWEVWMICCWQTLLDLRMLLMNYVTLILTVTQCLWAFILFHAQLKVERRMQSCSSQYYLGMRTGSQVFDGIQLSSMVSLNGVWLLHFLNFLLFEWAESFGKISFEIILPLAV